MLLGSFGRASVDVTLGCDIYFWTCKKSWKGWRFILIWVHCLEIKNKRPSPDTSDNLNSLPQWDPKLHAQGVPYASSDPQEELEEPSLMTWWRLIKALIQMYSSLIEQLWMAGGTTRCTYVMLCLMPHRSQHVDCVQGISAETLCLVFCIQPHSFSKRDACTNPWWGKGQRWDPEQLEECGNGSRHIPLASQWSVVPPLHLGPRPNSNKNKVSVFYKSTPSAQIVLPSVAGGGVSGGPRAAKVQEVYVPNSPWGWGVSRVGHAESSS